MNKKSAFTVIAPYEAWCIQKTYETALKNFEFSCIIFKIKLIQALIRINSYNILPFIQNLKYTP